MLTDGLLIVRTSSGQPRLARYELRNGDSEAYVAAYYDAIEAAVEATYSTKTVPPGTELVVVVFEDTTGYTVFMAPAEVDAMIGRIEAAGYVKVESLHRPP